MIRNIKTRVIIAGWIAVMGILGGCAVEKEDEEKVRDLEFTVGSGRAAGCTS